VQTSGGKPPADLSSQSAASSQQKKKRPGWFAKLCHRLVQLFLPFKEHIPPNGVTPTEMALAFCYTKWQVASTIIGVTSVAQLDADLDVWGKTLSPDVLAAIDAIRWEMRDPAL